MSFSTFAIFPELLKNGLSLTSSKILYFLARTSKIEYTKQANIRTYLGLNEKTTKRAFKELQDSFYIQQNIGYVYTVNAQKLPDQLSSILGTDAKIQIPKLEGISSLKTLFLDTDKANKLGLNEYQYLIAAIIYLLIKAKQPAKYSDFCELLSISLKAFYTHYNQLSEKYNFNFLKFGDQNSSLFCSEWESLHSAIILNSNPALTAPNTQTAKNSVLSPIKAVSNNKVHSESVDSANNSEIIAFKAIFSESYNSLFGKAYNSFTKQENTAIKAIIEKTKVEIIDKKGIIADDLLQAILQAAIKKFFAYIVSANKYSVPENWNLEYMNKDYIRLITAIDIKSKADKAAKELAKLTPEMIKERAKGDAIKGLADLGLTDEMIAYLQSNACVCLQTAKAYTLVVLYRAGKYDGSNANNAKFTQCLKVLRPTLR